MVISSFRPRIGGAEQLTERLSAELNRKGVRVVVLTRRFPGLARHETLNGVQVHRVGFPSGSKFGAFTFGIHALWALARNLKMFELIHVQNPDTPLLVGLCARLLLRRRLFFTVHSEPEALFGGVGLRRSGPLRLRLAARWAAGIIALTEDMSRELAARGVPSQRLSVVAGGVDERIFHPPPREARRRSRSKLAIEEDVSAFLFAGRFHAVKQVDLLLHAWSLLPPSTDRLLLLVGNGPEESHLRALSERYGLTNVRFRPFTDQVAEYLYAADVFVLPSRREGLSVALLEAMATGLAVLASDLPGNRAVIRNGRNGLIFPRGDAEQLAAGLLRLHEPDLRRRLGAAACSTIRSHYSLRRLASEHQRLYGFDLEPHDGLQSRRSNG